jgi:hypothetical protein
MRIGLGTGWDHLSFKTTTDSSSAIHFRQTGRKCDYYGLKLMRPCFLFISIFVSCIGRVLKRNFCLTSEVVEYSVSLRL